MGKKNTEKFSFGVDFQESILKFIASDKMGYKALALFDDSYFTLLSHQFVAFGLASYFKKKKRIPGKVVFNEYIRQLYSHKSYKQYLTPQIQEEVKEVITKVFDNPPRDSEDILEECIKFAQYKSLKTELENIDVTDFANYELAHKKIKAAISIGNIFKENKGIFLIREAQERMVKRANQSDVVPTPYWQWDASINSGGFGKGDLVMIMAKPKRFKTGVLLNMAKARLRQRKKVLYIDLENGQMELATRADQSITNMEQQEVLSGDYDQKILKQLRKYRRLGSELYIKRMPALETTCEDIQKLIDELWAEYGIRFDECYIDYGDLLGANSGKKDDTERISDAYLDMKNLALVNSFDCIITASHVKREAEKREGSIYLANDVAKCIDKIRHLDIVLGLQEDEEEKANGVMRLTVVEQRNGPRDYNMYFWVDIKKQTMKEFTHKEVKALREQSEEIKKKQKELKEL